jgi:diaminohydroxyphosphoribosylaminopyrimidine deaminase / 5-amino-6-(5-phosphoribosylamino)uracil reductase
MQPPSSASAVADGELQQAAWRALLAASTALRGGSRREWWERSQGARAAQQGPRPAARIAPDARGARGPFGIDAHGTRVAAGGSAWLSWSPGEGWTVGSVVPAPARPLLELFAPICGATPERPITLAHLGQSLDGCIATASGDSYYVTGPDNVVHLHRLRALCDAIVVGAGTVQRDDPLLTVRHVDGPNPVRVVLDPNGRLAQERRVFGADAPTLWVRGAESGDSRGARALDVLPIESRDGKLDLRALLSALHRRGLFAVFVEGGGATVSAFLEAGLLDRLQIAVAPLVTGSGRPGLSLPAREEIAECLRPRHRVFRMGDDVLFDCDLRSQAPAAAEASGTLQRVL